MSRVTTAWTDLHAPMIAIVVTLGSGLWLAASVGGFPGLVLVAIGAAVLLPAIFGDLFLGVALGLLGAAATLASFIAFAATAVGAYAGAALSIFASATLAGIIHERIQTGRRRAVTAAQQTARSAAPLGMMSTEDAHARLDEEAERARLHRRPLCTAMVSIEITDETLSPQDVYRVHRAVARVLESELRPTDIPFVGEHGGEFGIILPESDQVSAADILASALLLARDATVVEETGDSRRKVHEVAEVAVALRTVTEDCVCPAQTIEETRSEVAPLPLWFAA